MRGDTGGNYDEAAVVILDDYHDLIRYGQLAQSGGKHIFYTIATGIVVHTVDNRGMKCILASESSLLANHFSGNTAGLGGSD
jgi:hypothetical protein